MNTKPSRPLVAADPNEIFDVVDAQDRVVDSAPRGEVHARKLLHRAVHVIVHDSAGRIFLQQRSHEKDSCPGCWDCSSTGHLDSGEDYLTAARRELGEEIGLYNATQPLRPMLKLAASAETGFEFIQVYVLGPHEGPFDLNPAEIILGRWFTSDELDTLVAGTPERVAGVLRLLWTSHRSEILAMIS